LDPLPETQELLNRLISYGDTEIALVLMAMGRKAKQIVPECVGLSLGLVEEGLTFTLVASDATVAGLDAIQYLDGGPCVAGTQDGDTLQVTSQELMDEQRWQMYARATAASGVASSLSLPIQTDDRVIGGVNLYASTPDAFSGRHQELAAALGARAEGAMTNADLSFSTRLKAAQASQTFQEQTDVSVAVGIIAEQQRVDTGTARERLREAAARAGITEAQLARTIKAIQSTLRGRLA